jgi:hypothetical protein
VTIAPTCVRKAWLTLGSQSVSFEGPGYYCQSLDLGAPIVRDVTTNRPDAHGMDDRTAYFAGRTVTVNITAMATTGAQIDAVAASFAPFMLPGGPRPVLHYVLDRPGAPERVLTVRGESYDWPIVGAVERDIVLTFIAADPIVRDPVTQTVTSWSGSTLGGGRTYPFVPPRVYPTGGAIVSGTIVTHGDLPAQPMLNIYGPITTPKVTLRTLVANTLSQVWALAGFAIAAGHFCAVDTAARTAYMDGDPSQNVLGQIDWVNTIWPVIPPSPDGATMTLAGDASGGVMSAVTQVQASWQDAYLS